MPSNGGCEESNGSRPIGQPSCEPLFPICLASSCWLHDTRIGQTVVLLARQIASDRPEIGRLSKDCAIPQLDLATQLHAREQTLGRATHARSASPPPMRFLGPVVRGRFVPLRRGAAGPELPSKLRAAAGRRRQELIAWGSWRIVSPKPG